MNDICGTCTMCCRNLGIGDTFRGEPFHKPAGKWCEHCAIGHGCKVYEERPDTCREFQCVYLAGKMLGEPLDIGLRPDHCGVVVSPTTDERRFAVTVDANKPDAWRRGMIYRFLMSMVRGGIALTLSTGNTKHKTMIHQRNGRIEIGQVQFGPPDEKGMQWSIPSTYRRLGYLREG